MKKIFFFGYLNIKNKSKKDRSKNEAKMRIALGIDFSWIFLDFGRQVGAKLASKIDRNDAKKHPINDGKQEASRRRLGGILEVQEVSGGGGSTRRSADFRSLNEKFEREEGA